MRSFDVFDTLLVRAVAEPRDVAVSLGEELRDAGLTALRPEEFARVRAEAQDRAAHVAPAGEATLDEIYAELAAMLGWERALTRECLDREIALEGRLVRGVPARRREIAAARAAGEPVVFLSDTQLPSAAIRGWLEREGLWLAGDRIFVSCEARATKRDGSLFRVALRETEASPETWRHVGDSPDADVTAPRQLGLGAREEAAGRLTHREQRLRGPARFSPSKIAPTQRETLSRPSTASSSVQSSVLWRSALAGASRRVRLDAPIDVTRGSRPVLTANPHEAPDASSTRTDERPARVVWETAASVAAPLFFAFTAWVLEEAQRRGVRRLYFVARGGQIFFRIAEQLNRAAQTGIECRYLYLSRRVLVGLGDAQQGRLRESITAPGEIVQTLARVHSNLGFAATDPLPTELTTADQHRPLSSGEREHVADCYLAPEQRPAVERRLAERAESARAYLEKEGVASTGPIAFVDTGWAGSLQRALENFLGDAGRPAPQTWFYLGLREGMAARPAGEALGYFNTFRPLPLAREPWLTALLELMARADHGTLRDYSPAPELEPVDRDELESVRSAQTAMLAWTRGYLETSGGLLPPAADCAPVVIEGFADFAAHPTEAEARAWGRMPHQVHPADPRSDQLCPPMTISAVCNCLTHASRRPPAWWLPGQAALGGLSAALIRAWLRSKRLRPAH